MEIIRLVSEMQKISEGHKKNNKKVAFVPTMGYFHDGHTTLMKKAREYGDVVIASLFVNPTQFAPNEDFTRYPRDFERDCKMASEAGVDYLFNPDVSEMYPQGYKTEIKIGEVTTKFEGQFRPTHFDGVATVVAKLFNATKPDFAIFGQKDYQQTLVIKKLVKDLLFDTRIIVSPTIREHDGLAKSSRNIYLSSEEREDALVLSRALDVAIGEISNGVRNRIKINAIMHNQLRKVSGIRIDYASSALADDLSEPEEFMPDTKIVLLIAVYIGKTRLIDNALVTVK